MLTINDQIHLCRRTVIAAESIDDKEEGGCVIHKHQSSQEGRDIERWIKQQAPPAPSSSLTQQKATAGGGGDYQEGERRGATTRKARRQKKKTK